MGRREPLLAWTSKTLRLPRDVDRRDGKVGAVVSARVGCDHLRASCLLPSGDRRWLSGAREEKRTLVRGLPTA